jgi:glycosyltransferase involved in cell wall biosynthesis
MIAVDGDSGSVMVKVLIVTGKPLEVRDSGAEIRNFAIARALQQQFEIVSVSVSARAGDKGFGWTHHALSDQSPENCCIKPKPFALAYTVTPGMIAKLRQLVESESPDLILFETLAAAPYLTALAGGSTPLVLDMHNDETLLAREILNAEIQAMGFLQRLKMKRRHRRLQQWQHKALLAADQVWCCSREDAVSFVHAGIGGNRIEVVPNPMPQRFPHVIEAPSREEPRALFVGALSYLPNHSGLIWFIDQVAPRVLEAVPGFRLDIVGRWPKPQLLERIESLGWIQGHFDVDALEPFYRRSAVCLVPLLEGGGTRIKILEATEAGRAVVSTSKGAEGMEPELLQRLYLADEPEAFAGHLIRLFTQGPDVERCGEELRRASERFYGTEAIRDAVVRAVDRLSNLSGGQSNTERSST